VRRRIDACRQNERVSTVEEIEAVSHLLKNERELQIAREIQRGFLPTELPCPEGWEIEARFRPAREVAGDFYDGFELVNGRRMGFVVGDVCDKGVGAALFMALIRTLLRHGAQQSNPGEMLVSDLSAIATATVEDQPDAASQIPALPTIGALPLTSAVRGTNEYMTRNHLEQGYFVTLLFFVLDPVSGSVLYINGGHNPPVVLRTDGSRELLAPTGPAVGLFPGAVFDLAHTTLEVGDTLFAYTDGVTEARDSVGDFFTDARMHKVLADPVESAQELLDRIDGAVVGFVGAAEQSDDLTMLAMRRVPPGEAGVESGRQD
jgi:phosphoserine phosphatase RsbU/P